MRFVEHMTYKRLTVFLAVVMLAAVSLYAQSVPKPLKTRLVVGDPIWRELPVREELQKEYDRVWQTALNALLEHNYDIATMEKSSGYLRTTWNERVVTLQDNWYYKLQINVKLVTAPSDRTRVEKSRVQVTGEVTNVDRKSGAVKAYFRGYDQTVLQNLMQDLQAKLGAI